MSLQLPVLRVGSEKCAIATDKKGYMYSAFKGREDFNKLKMFGIIPRDTELVEIGTAATLEKGECPFFSGIKLKTSLKKINDLDYDFIDEEIKELIIRILS